MNSPLHQDIDPELLVRFLSSEANAQERQIVQQWIEMDDRHRNYVQEMTLLWAASALAKDAGDINVADDWKKVMAKVNGLKPSNGLVIEKASAKADFLWLFARIAAAIIVLISSYFIIQYFSRPASDLKTVIATANMSEIVLPDGSHVYLNKNARLTYPDEMNGETRDVSLEGEAFFEVAKDSSKPFFINAGGTITQVVGTSFNVNSDIDSTVVTVVTGKVQLYKQRDSAYHLTLTPGSQGIYSKTTGLIKRDNSDQNFLSWKTNVLIFKNTPLTKVVDDLNKHFGVRIRIAAASLKNCTLTSTFTRQTLEEILEEMQLVLSIHVERKDETIIITGKGC